MGIASSVSRTIIPLSEAQRRCTPNELQRFRKLFDRWTTGPQKKDSKRTIDKNIFMREVLGGLVPQQIAERMFSNFDVNKSGFLTEKDFVCAMALFLHGTPHEKCQFVFDIYDIKEAGTIGIDDMIGIFQTDVILAKDERRSKQTILTESFNRADLDKDGKLKFRGMITLSLSFSL